MSTAQIIGLWLWVTYCQPPRKIQQPAGAFCAVVIDPPWAYRTWAADSVPSRISTAHYSVLTLERIQQLPIKSLLKPDAAVFLWVTMPLLDVGVETGKAWGLQYKTCAFTWVKSTRRTAGRFVPSVEDKANWHTGLGYWTRANPELCLLFTQGNPKRLAKDVPELLVAPVGKHSAKPEEAQSRVERLVAGPYLEIFARRRRAGWTCIGNEIDGLDVFDAIAELNAGELAA